MFFSKLFKGSGIFVNEDLTKLNAEVLASVRLKQPSAVEKTWSFEGKIFALFKGNEHATQIKFSDFKNWLEKPWPKNHTQSVLKPQLVQQTEYHLTSHETFVTTFYFAVMNS
ncbi:hypothetical protein DPMN_114832 [Dreissena polymorpha]|uniref:Uncharacterized protein n=1 Tax=Dreissena polymorpha TaxID=45954 RepID=A0A9D4KK81_DREPO|nr:hypothetical protein DPMN_114832 [Dreissena polymorpha]